MMRAGNSVGSEVRRWTWRGLALLLAACSGSGGNSGGQPTGPTPSATITLSPPTLTVQQGTQVTLNATLGLSNLTGSATLRATGVPAGVSIPSTTVSASGSVAVSVDVSTSAQVGTTVVTLQVLLGGTVLASQPFDLVVIPIPTGGFALAASPSSISVQQGATGATTIDVIRTAPFAGPVALAASGAPTGVTVGFLPSPVGSSVSQATVSIAVPSTLAPGTYSLTITGSSSGVADHAIALTLTVTSAPPGSGAQFNWTFCSDETPLWLAVRDGTGGTWTEVTPAGGVYSFSFQESLAGVAVVFDGAGSGLPGSRLNAYLATVAELTEASSHLRIEGLCTGSEKTVNVTVPGLGATETAAVQLGFGIRTATPAAPTVTLPRVRSGPLTLAAARYGTPGSATSVLVRRGVDAAAGSTLTADFAGPDAFAPVSVNLSSTGGGGDLLSLTSSFVPAGGFAHLGIGGAVGAGSATVATIPAGQLVSGDVLVFGAAAVSNTAPVTRDVLRYVASPADQTMSFGPLPSTPVVTVASAAPYVRPRLQQNSQSEYDDALIAIFGQSLSGQDRVATIRVQAAYQGGGDWDLIFPDFTGTSGWRDEWAFAAGTVLNYSTIALGNNGVGFGLPGLEIKSGFNLLGSIIP